ncbi:MAG: enoyl-CoA hydratase/isomerase family protein [Acidimicrobiales bacterium]
MQRSQVELTRSGRVATLTLPGGALDRRSALELEDALGELAEDDSDQTRVIVLTPAGGEFCTGVAEDLRTDTSGLDPPARLLASRRVVVACVPGACRSLGMAIALAADIRIVAPTTRFALPEVVEGALPGWNAAWLTARVVGPARATPMVLLGAEVGGEEAVAIGLAHQSAPDPAARAAEVALLLAGRGPLALEYTKEAVWRGAGLPLTEALRLEADFNHLLQASSDRAEGLAAFFEKREPRFTGR